MSKANQETISSFTDQVSEIRYTDPEDLRLDSSSPGLVTEAQIQSIRKNSSQKGKPRCIQPIIPNAIYPTEILKEIIRDHYKINTLRQFGLIGSASGYWGQNIIDSINRFLEHKYQNRFRNGAIGDESMESEEGKSGHRSLSGMSQTASDSLVQKSTRGIKQETQKEKFMRMSSGKGVI